MRRMVLTAQPIDEQGRIGYDETEHPPSLADREFTGTANEIATELLGWLLLRQPGEAWDLTLTVEYAK